MADISTHVLDISRGRPAAGLDVILEKQSEPKEWTVVGRGTTDADGRLSNLLPANFRLEPGLYRLTFATAKYFSDQKVESFYPEITIAFNVRGASESYHIPVLLSPYGYTTYRGT